MRIFETFYTAYEELLNCPDPFSLEAYRIGELPVEEHTDIYTHLQDCAACQQALEHLQQNPEPFGFEQTHLPPSQAPLSLPPPPAAFASGQIWLSKSALALQRYHLGTPDAEPVNASYMRHFVIIACGKKSFGNADYQRLTVCPLSEMIALASDQDLILPESEHPLGCTLMAEVWNQQTLLALHLSDYLGQLSDTALTQLQRMSELQSGGQPLQGSGLPRGGTPEAEHAPHLRFKALETEQALYLGQPVQALQALEAFTRDCFIEVSRQTLRKQFKPGLHSPLVPPGRMPKPAETLLAASSQTESEAPAEAEIFKEQLQLHTDVLLDIWLEGPNLELYCHTLEGKDIAGFTLMFIDRSGQRQSLRTDDFGALFVPLNQFQAQEPTLLYLTLNWQSQTYQYVYPFILKES